MAPPTADHGTPAHATDECSPLWPAAKSATTCSAAQHAAPSDTTADGRVKRRLGRVSHLLINRLRFSLRLDLGVRNDVSSQKVLSDHYLHAVMPVLSLLLASFWGACYLALDTSLLFPHSFLSCSITETGDSLELHLVGIMSVLPGCSCKT